MPLTRSRSKNRSPTTSKIEQYNDSDSLSPRQRRKGCDVIDNVASTQLTACKRCGTPLENACLYSKDLETIQNQNGCFWLCEECFISSPKDEQHLCFHRILNYGGFCEYEEEVTPHHLLSVTIQRVFKIFSWCSKWFDFLKHFIFISKLREAFSILFSKYTYNAFFALFVVLIISVSFVFYFKQPVSEETAIEEKMYESFHQLAKAFPRQDVDLWTNLASGLKRITSSTEIAPAVFLILHSNNTKTALCVIKQVCNLAHQHLKVASPPLLIDVDELHNKYDDYGDFIDEVTESIKSTKISVIENLQKMPGNMARALHVLTDEYNPSVKKVIFLMSIPLNESIHSTSNIFEIAEEILQETWQDVNADSLGPLIARLTNNVVKVEDEIKFPDYC